MVIQSEENITSTWNNLFNITFNQTLSTISTENSNLNTTDITIQTSTYNQKTEMYINITDNATEKYLEDGSCEDWQDAQHALFQLANLCLVVAFLTPSSFKYHAFFLRCILNFGFLFFSLWAGLFVCMPDILSWNLGFCLVNSIHICYQGYKMFPPRIGAELDGVYIKMFKPLNISRQMFKDLKTIGDLYILTKGNTYAKEGKTKCGEKISILLKGR